MRNPCLEDDCGYRDLDKNNETCRKCEKRIQYVASMGGMPSLMVVKPNDCGEVDGKMEIVKDDKKVEDGSRAWGSQQVGELRICKSEACEFAGELQPVGGFYKSKGFISSNNPKGYMSKCKKCTLRDQVVNKKKARKSAKQESVCHDDENKNLVEVDFSKYPEVLKLVKSEARRQFRTLKQQILYIVHGYCELRGDLLIQSGRKE